MGGKMLLSRANFGRFMMIFLYLKVLNETLVIYNVSQNSVIDYQISQIKSRLFHTHMIAIPTMIFKVLID